MIFDA